MPERIYHLDLVNNTLVVAMASRLFNIYDIRKMDMPAQQRESSLKYMTRSLACMPDREGEQCLTSFLGSCAPVIHGVTQGMLLLLWNEG
jgi:hypothetical protein